MGHLPPSSSHPLPGHLNKSYLPLMGRKQVNLRLGDLVPSRQLGPAQEACTAEPGGHLPGDRGRSSLAGPRFVTWVSAAGVGRVEVAVREGLWGRWVAQNRFYTWTGRNFNQNSHRGWAWATFPYLAGKRGRGRGSRPTKQALNTPGLGPGAQLLQSRRAETRPDISRPIPKAPGPTWLSCPELGQKTVGA